MNRRGLLGLAGAAVGLGAGIAAEHTLVRRRRRNDPESREPFGNRRGLRSRVIERPDGARIFIEEAGPRKRRGCVFVHGSALRTDTWHYQLAGIDAHRLVFFDLRGHGRSTQSRDSMYSIESLGDDLGAVIADSKLDEVVIAGHSVGGMIALDYAVRNSDQLGSRIKGLALLNATYRPPIETLTGGAALTKAERFLRHPLDLIGKQSRHIDRLREFVRPTDALFWTVSFAAFGPGAPATHVDFSYDMLADTPADVIFNLIKAYRDFDVRDLLDEVKVPVLVIGGTHDRLTLPTASEYMAERLPDAELHLLAGCGHMSMLERHDEINSLLDDFLARAVPEL
jgi:pimeloyl-ACP methyl ester carboxylesterase